MRDEPRRPVPQRHPKAHALPLHAAGKTRRPHRRSRNPPQTTARGRPYSRGRAQGSCGFETTSARFVLSSAGVILHRDGRTASAILYPFQTPRRNAAPKTRYDTFCLCRKRGRALRPPFSARRFFRDRSEGSPLSQNFFGLRETVSPPKGA